MRLTLVLTEGSWLNEELYVKVDWPHNAVPQKGDILGDRVVGSLINWDSFTKEDILIYTLLDYRAVWNERYNVSMNGNGRHADAMRFMMDAYLHNMVVVKKVIWRMENGVLYPEVWLDNIRGYDVQSKADKSGIFKDRKIGVVFCAMMIMNLFYMAYLLYILR